MTRARARRVLIVDDSAIARRVLTEALSDTDDIEVVGTARDGRTALLKVMQLAPDVVTLDLEMPVMDGMKTLEEMRRSSPGVQVIIVSATSEAGAKATIQALQAGASDYVKKPSSLARIEDAVAALRDLLVPRIRALTVPDSPRTAAPGPVHPSRIERPRADRELLRPTIIAMGVSTGGPRALAQILPKLPGDLAVPIVIVQHMPPIFTATLARSLDETCALRVEEAGEGALLGPGRAWIAPGDFHMILEPWDDEVRIRLTQDPEENSCRPAVDPLFRSVARIYGDRALAFVLTGMGQDGLCGAERLRDCGATVVAQDEASSTVWGMPGAVVSAGLADEVLPAGEIPAFIHRVLSRPVGRE